jgi:hypothetical protein
MNGGHLALAPVSGTQLSFGIHHLTKQRQTFKYDVIAYHPFTLLLALCQLPRHVTLYVSVGRGSRVP